MNIVLLELIQIYTWLAHSFLTTPLFSAECPAGSYKDDDMNECAECPHNKISTESRDSCTSCEPGEIRNSERTECGKNCL